MKVKNFISTTNYKLSTHLLLNFNLYKSIFHVTTLTKKNSSNI